jgi:hypothetical protein
MPPWLHEMGGRGNRVIRLFKLVCFLLVALSTSAGHR